MPSEKHPLPNVAVDDEGSRLAANSQPLTPAAASGLSNAPAKRRSEHLEGMLLASKYRLVRKLGSGGMGAIWVAHNEALGNEVAIKLIRNDLDDPVLTLRLMTEARAIARLGHPNIVRVYDVEQTETGQPFIVMELLRGQTLGAKIRRHGRMEPARAVQTLLPIAHALAATHTEGIIHRDLKPDNIMLEERDDLGIRPVIVDFGIAKVRISGATKITQDGATLGSPEYMSPEQARGDEVDARADMWAFCILLYECLLGHVPFTDTNYHRLLRRIIDEPIPSFSRVGIRDDALWAIIERGLSKNPNERFDSMRTLGVRLAYWLLDIGVTDDVGHGSVRATWLQGSTTLSQELLGSHTDAVPTLTSVPSEPPVLLVDGAQRRRERAKRLVWFAVIFLAGILGTALMRSWLRGSSVNEAAASAPLSTLPAPESPVTAEVQAGRAVPTVAPTVSDGESTPVHAPPASVSNKTPPESAHPVEQRKPIQRRVDTATRSPRSAPATHNTVPGRLDIKTDF